MILYKPYRFLAIVACALGLGGCFHPRRTEPTAELRVMTYNIRSGNGDLAITAAAIEAEHPDVVALQEVDVRWGDRSAFADQPAELGRLLHMTPLFAHIYVLPGAPGAPAREFGVALLSRFPVARFRNDTITRLSTQDTNPAPRPMPGLLEAAIDVRGTRVRVFNTHLDYRRDPRVREAQVADMLRFIGASDEPTIVFGDMNASPDAPALQPLLRRLHDAWPSSNGPGFTYPADKPSERIDYVLVSDAFRVRTARVPATEASDHRPVVVDLELPPAAVR